MIQTTADRLIAHVNLLRAVDRLLRDADEVRKTREELFRAAGVEVPDEEEPGQHTRAHEGGQQ